MKKRYINVIYEALKDERCAIEMSKVGEFGELEIWIWPNEGGDMPHFRFCCTAMPICGSIKLEAAEYFDQTDFQDRLNGEQIGQLVAFLKSQSKNHRGFTNWKVVVGLWNDNSLQKKLALDLEMPNYLELK